MEHKLLLSSGTGRCASHLCGPCLARRAGIVVGCISPIKSLLFAPNPPLRVLAEALETLGNGLIPVTLPLLGAVLYR